MTKIGEHGVSQFLCEHDPLQTFGIFRPFGLRSVNGLYCERSMEFDGKVGVDWDIRKNHEESLMLRVGVADGSYGRGRLYVYANGIQIGDSGWVSTGEQAHIVHAELNGATRLTFQTEGETTLVCQGAVFANSDWLQSAFGVARMRRTPTPHCAVNLCVATACDNAYAAQTLELACSLTKNGGADALLVVFSYGLSKEWQRRLIDAGVHLIESELCLPQATGHFTATYRVAQFVNARHYLLLDADTRVLRSLAPLISLLDCLDGDTLIAAREPTIPKHALLGDALCHPKAPFGGDGLGESGDLSILELTQSEYSEKFVAAGGFLGGSRTALLMFETVCHSFMPNATHWITARPKAHRPEQGLLGAALVRHGTWVEAAPQIRAEAAPDYARVQSSVDTGLQAKTANGTNVCLLHFGGEIGKSLSRSALVSGAFGEPLQVSSKTCSTLCAVRDFYLVHASRIHKNVPENTKYWEQFSVLLADSLKGSGSSVLFAGDPDGVLPSLAQECHHEAQVITASAKHPPFFDLAQNWRRVEWAEGDPITRLAQLRSQIMTGEKEPFEVIVMDVAADEKEFQTLAALCPFLLASGGSLLVGNPENAVFSMRACAAILSRSGWHLVSEEGYWQIWRHTG